MICFVFLFLSLIQLVWHGVFLAEPAAQVDLPAAGAAKWPRGRRLGIEWSVTDGTTHGDYLLRRFEQTTSVNRGMMCWHGLPPF